MLQVKNLSVEFWGETTFRAVKGLTFEVGAGELYGLVGESGSGKSTAIRAITKTVPIPGVISSGSVIFDGQDLIQMNQKELEQVRWSKIARVFQSAMSAMNPVTKIGGQMLDVMERHGAGGDEAHRQILTWLERVGLESEVVNRYPHELSGGMLQRVCLAMSMLLKPRLLLLDEPTTALDVLVQRKILDTIFEVCQTSNVAAILVSHDLPLVAHYCQRIGVLYQGELVDEGTPHSLVTEAKHEHTRALIHSSWPEHAP